MIKNTGHNVVDFNFNFSSNILDVLIPNSYSNLSVYLLSPAILTMTVTIVYGVLSTQRYILLALTLTLTTHLSLTIAS